MGKSVSGMANVSNQHGENGQLGEGATLTLAGVDAMASLFVGVRESVCQGTGSVRWIR